ncbi:MAG: hypothetical protein JNM43_10390 [Planctomycetaceae bacterium]|nr:hypothetical protein [Planctomycetaceae bacterium]
MTENVRPQRIGDSLWSIAFVWFLFAAVSFLSSQVPAVNEPHYLCKAKAFETPAWCKRDFFLRSANAHYVFLKACGKLTPHLSLPALAIAGRLASTLVLAIGWWRLIGAVVPNGRETAWAMCLSAVLYALLSQLGSFSGEWLLGGFEAKVPSWGFALAATAEMIRAQSSLRLREFLLAGICAGIALALHPVVGGWMAACLFGMGAVFQWKRWISPPAAANGPARTVASGPWQLLVFSVAVVVSSLPGLWPAIKFLTRQTASSDDQLKASMIQVFWRLAHHLDPTHLSRRQWAYAAVLLIAIAIAAVSLKKRAARSGSESSGYSALATVFGFSSLIAVIGIAAGWHSQSFAEMYLEFQGWKIPATVLKFYPFRTFDGLLPIVAAIGLTLLTLHRLSLPQSEKAPENGGIKTRRITIVGLLVMCAFSMAWRQGSPAPPGYTAAQFEDWKQACDWIRANTPKDSLILTPRESYGFKWFAERAEYVCYKDCPQDAKGILEWNDRLWFLHDWTLKSSGDAVYSDSDLKELRQKTKCDFVLTRILGPFESQPLWSSREWRIYAVPVEN